MKPQASVKQTCLPKNDPQCKPKLSLCKLLHASFYFRGFTPSPPNPLTPTHFPRLFPSILSHPSFYAPYICGIMLNFAGQKSGSMLDITYLDFIAYGHGRQETSANRLSKSLQAGGHSTTSRSIGPRHARPNAATTATRPPRGTPHT